MLLAADFVWWKIVVPAPQPNDDEDVLLDTETLFDFQTTLLNGANEPTATRRNFGLFMLYGTSCCGKLWFLHCLRKLPSYVWNTQNNNCNKMSSYLKLEYNSTFSVFRLFVNFVYSLFHCVLHCRGTSSHENDKIVCIFVTRAQLLTFMHRKRACSKITIHA